MFRIFRYTGNKPETWASKRNRPQRGGLVAPRWYAKSPTPAGP